MEKNSCSNGGKPEKKKAVKSNKERARLHRLRKKKYLEDMNEKVRQFEDRVLELEQENIRLATIIAQFEQGKTEGIKSDREMKIIEAENYATVLLPKLIKSDPDKVRFSMIHQAFDNLEMANEDRVILIKQSFKTILDYIVSVETKVIYACFKNLDISEWAKQNTSNKRTQKYV